MNTLAILIFGMAIILLLTPVVLAMIVVIRNKNLTTQEIKEKVLRRLIYDPMPLLLATVAGLYCFLTGLSGHYLPIIIIGLIVMAVNVTGFWYSMRKFSSPRGTTTT